MFIGHIGVGLALKRGDKQINAAWPIFFSMMPDLLLGIFVLLGIENVIIPEDYTQKRYLDFVFPYSHGLAASIIWTALIFCISYLLINKTGRLKYALIFASAFLLHIVSDVIEHVRGLPIMFNSSSTLGLGLWKNIEYALLLEIILFLAGLTVYLRASDVKSKRVKYGVPVFLGIIAIAAIAGQLKSPPPPDQNVVALSWLFQNLLIIPVVYWLDKERVKK